MQVIARVLWLKQSLEDAINAKRIHHQLFPNVAKYEFDYPNAVLQELGKYGHNLQERKTYMAVVQVAARDPQTGEVSAMSDPRKRGEASLVYEDEL